MLNLEAVRAFLKVAELSGFTRAATQLGLTKSKVSLLVTGLEAQLGSRLFQRSTRTVQLTADGEAFLSRAQRLVHDADELATMFSAPSTLSGRLRIDLPVNLARNAVIPRLPEFLAAHPQLEVLLSATDRRVDLLREGFDVVLRVGALADSTLQARRLGALSMVNCIGPAYALKHGVPKTLEDLDRHYLVHYSTRLSGETPTFEYKDGGRYREKAMRALITVNNVDAYHAACIAGLGLMQVPRLASAAAVASGQLLAVLPQYQAAPLPVTLVHGYARSVPARVKALMDWLAKVLAPHVQ